MRIGSISVTGSRPRCGLIWTARTNVRHLSVLHGRTSLCNTTAASTGSELGPIPVLPVRVHLPRNRGVVGSGTDVSRKTRSCTSYLTLLSHRRSTCCCPGGSAPRMARPTIATAPRRALSRGRCRNGRPLCRGPLSSGTPTTGRVGCVDGVHTTSIFLSGGWR